MIVPDDGITLRGWTSTFGFEERRRHGQCASLRQKYGFVIISRPWPAGSLKYTPRPHPDITT